MECGVVPLLLRDIRDAPLDSLEHLWTLLTNAASFPAFSDRLLSESGPLLVQE
ncbi:hypothetical protein B484DRAFT_411620, partial [Ochromonadaceae sp. CCMP2298]